MNEAALPERRRRGGAPREGQEKAEEETTVGGPGPPQPPTAQDPDSPHPRGSDPQTATPERRQTPQTPSHDGDSRPHDSSIAAGSPAPKEPLPPRPLNSHSALDLNSHPLGPRPHHPLNLNSHPLDPQPQHHLDALPLPPLPPLSGYGIGGVGVGVANLPEAGPGSPAAGTPPVRHQALRQKRSRVWEHFDPPAGSRVRCRVCGVSLMFHKSTTALREHLRRKHALQELSISLDQPSFGSPMGAPGRILGGGGTLGLPCSGVVMARRGRPSVGSAGSGAHGGHGGPYSSTTGGRDDMGPGNHPDLMRLLSGGGAQGLAVLGAGPGSIALLGALQEADALGLCRVLYVLAQQPGLLEGALEQPFLARTRLMHAHDADIALNDQRVSGVVVCAQPPDATELVLVALRQGKGVLCEHLLGESQEASDACFQEAISAGKPLLCGFYRRFDPALQLIQRRIEERGEFGQITRVAAVSYGYPPPNFSLLHKSAGGIFYDSVVHDVDTVCWLVGGGAPENIYATGSAFTQESAAMSDADVVCVTLRFPGGALGTVESGRSGPGACEHRVEVRGTQLAVRVEAGEPLGVRVLGPAGGPWAPLPSQTSAQHYRAARAALVHHFLHTLTGAVSPGVSQEDYNRAVGVCSAAEQYWREGCPRDAALITIVKTEVM
ncbi:uncharacterized protein LOC133352422 isoform X2 [Lethenteron reissneri]|uniref:uncharacterized protein LOC133352422 isoform X2 n=1 Tax=Lethenteron reissneri TaxID=7753 RepID=UPI002AB5E13F|nr:uncharacterized protein LOC133352422 isoform X2 [Lethenteron reissneri]